MRRSVPFIDGKYLHAFSTMERWLAAETLQ
jgi:hypothetical protein